MKCTVKQNCPKGWTQRDLRQYAKKCGIRLTHPPKSGKTGYKTMAQLCDAILEQPTPSGGTVYSKRPIKTTCTISAGSWEDLPDEYWYDCLNDIGHNFQISDCGGGGDCQFHAIATALNEIKFLNQSWYPGKLRSAVADYIVTRYPSGQLMTSIQSYSEELEEEWAIKLLESGDIESIRTKFANRIRKCGNFFWGDDVTLSIMHILFNLNFVIFNNDTGSIFIYENQQFPYYIILYYYDELHYQLIGYLTQDDVKTTFTNDEYNDHIKPHINDCQELITVIVESERQANL